MLSIGENTPEIKCKKKYQKMEFFLKHLTRDLPKKYQLSTDDYFFVFSISMWGGGGGGSIDIENQNPGSIYIKLFHYGII